MKTYVVQLDRHDDVISARDKISWSKARRVLLVWPRDGRVLERRVDLLLMMRRCQQTGAQMAIVTRSGEVKYHARALGIPVFRKPEQAQQSAWRGLGLQRRIWREGKPLTAQDLRQQRAELAEPDPFEARAAGNRWLRLGLFTLAVLSFLLLALSFAPGASVTLSPVRKTQQLNLSVWASPNIRAPNPSGGLPAYDLAVVVEGRAQAESSGQVLVPDRYAAGEVQLTNLTDQPVTVPQGSIVLAGDASLTRFMTTRAVRLPPGPGTSAAVPVQAAAPGRAGNAAAGQIQAMEGPLGLRLLAENPEPLTGGTDRSSPAPSQADYRRLRESLLSELRGRAVEEMRIQLEPGQRLLEDSLTVRAVLAEERDPAENLPGQQLQLTVRVEFAGWYVEETDLAAVARPILDASLEAGFQPVPGSFQVEFAGSPSARGSQQARAEDSLAWDVTMRRSVESAWNDARLVEILLGKRVEDARQILQDRLLLAEPPQIDLYPAWWGRMPFLPVRISLVKQ